MRHAEILLCALVVASCTGEIGDAPIKAEVTEPGPCEVAPARGTTFSELRRLSRTALANTLVALVGQSVARDDEIQAALNGLPSDTMILAGDFASDPPVGLPQTLDRIAKRASSIALADSAWRAAHLPTCAATSIPDDACAETVIREFGARVLRRDVEPADLALYKKVYDDAGKGEVGMSFVLRRLLQSPALAFHIERGAESSAGSIHLTTFEIASRISYFVADTMPDDELMRAARSGELLTLDAVRLQVHRMLQTPEGHAKSRDFFRYYAHLGDTPDPLSIYAARHGIDDVTGLGNQMRDEAFDFFDHVFFSGGGFHELMTSTDAFPRTTALATVFGSGIATDGPVVAPNHPGLLHRPALMTSPTMRTSPIIRGAHLRKLFLCESPGMPPNEDVMERERELGNIDDMANRDRVTLLTDSPTCLSCHVSINATGFAFEGFDQLGVPRTEETVLDVEGNVIATWPLDTTVADAVLGAAEPQPVASSIDLAVAVADSYAGRSCFTQRLFEYYRASVVAKADACTMSQAYLAATKGSLEDTLTALIAGDDIFYRLEPLP